MQSKMREPNLYSSEAAKTTFYKFTLFYNYIHIYPPIIVIYVLLGRAFLMSII